jgi:DNA-binding NarL/FixJ family response regulator
VVGTSLTPTVIAINDIVDNAITASRSLTTELSPPILRESLPRMMDWLVQWMESRHGLFVDVSSEPDLNEPSDEARKFLFQAVRELLMNVRKHAGTDRARVRIFAHADNLCIEVSDDGTGFDTAHTADGDHHAFGLFSIRERVEMLGGTLQIQSLPGRGSTCIIRVPVVPAHVEAARAAVAQESTGARDPAMSGKVRILVVDDHTIFRRGLISILETYPDLKVVGEASDGEEGVRRATELMPDVIIMDLAMPRMNGIEATRIIKSRFMSVDVLALSFQESDHARSSVLDAGASAYFTKSGPLDALLRAIRAHGNGNTDAPAPARTDATPRTHTAELAVDTSAPLSQVTQRTVPAPPVRSEPRRSASRRRRKA